MLNNKIIISIFIMVFLIGIVSAEFTFDNVVNYENNDLKANVVNFFGFGDKIGSAILESHNSPKEVKQMREGNDQAVMWYEFTDFKKNYKNGLGKVEFIDIKTGKKVKKDYYFARAIIETGPEKTYKTECFENTLPSSNGTGTYKDCRIIEEIVETTEIVRWEKLNNYDIPKENVVIGLITDVNKGDYIDGRWTIAGKKIKEHAPWSANFSAFTNQSDGFAYPTGVTQVRGIFNNITDFWFLKNNGQKSINHTDHQGNEYNDGVLLTGLINDAPNPTDMCGNGTDAYIVNFGGGPAGFINHIKYVAGAWVNQSDGFQWPTGMSAIYGIDCIGGEGETQGAITGFWLLDTTDHSFNRTDINGNIVSGFSSYNLADTSYSVKSNTTDLWSFTDSGKSFLHATYTGVNQSDLLNVSGWGLANAYVFTANEFGFWVPEDGDRHIYHLGIEWAYNPGLPSVFVDVPANLTNSSTATLLFNGTMTDNSQLENQTLYINGILNHTFVNGVNNNSNLTIELTFDDGAYTWDMGACDDDAVPQCVLNGSRTFIIDTTSPVLDLSESNRSVDYHIFDNNLTFNWSYTEPNPGSCTVFYQNQLFQPACADLNISLNITDYDYRSLNFTMNDTFGNINSTNITWEYKVFQYDVNYTEEVLSGSTQTFELNISKQSDLTISSIRLFYNTTSNVVLFDNVDNQILSSNVLIPTIESNVNISFNWVINFSSSDSVTTEYYNQSVKRILFDDCTSYSTTVFNYTMFDEEFQTFMDGRNATMEIYISLYDEDRTINILNFSKLYSNSTARICANLNLSNNFSLDSIVKYSSNESTGYVTEYYNIEDFNLHNGTVPQNIYLYDLLSDDSTDFKINFLDENYRTIEGALVYIQRQYMAENNTFKTVELPKTDSNGQTIGHFVRNDVVYNIQVVKDGEVIGDFQNLIAFCQDILIGDCQINLNARTSQGTNYTYNETIGLLVNDVDFNSTTGVISTSFIVPNGVTKTVKMNVTKEDIFGNTTVCSDELTSSSGTLTCTVSTDINEATLRVYVYTDDVFSVSKYFSVNRPAFGSTGFVIWFILTLVLIFIFDDSKTIVLVSLIISYVGAIGLGITQGNIVGIGASGLWIIIITVIGIWTINKDREQ